MYNNSNYRKLETDDDGLGNKIGEILRGCHVNTSVGISSFCSRILAI